VASSPEVGKYAVQPLLLPALMRPYPCPVALISRVFRLCHRQTHWQPVHGQRSDQNRRGRSGRWWLIDVPEVPAAHSQARRLDQAEAVARDLIALLTDSDPDSFDVEVKVQLPDEVGADLDRAEELRQEAARSQPKLLPGTVRAQLWSAVFTSVTVLCLTSDRPAVLAAVSREDLVSRIRAEWPHPRAAW
jgi:hypothetical protein